MNVLCTAAQRNNGSHTQVVVWERSEPVSVQFHIMSLLGVPSTHVHRRLFFVFVFLPSSVTILWIFAFYRMFRNGEAHKKLKTEPNNLHWSSTTTTAVQMVRYDEFMVHGSWKWYISYTTNITHIFEVNNILWECITIASQANDRYIHIRCCVYLYLFLSKCGECLVFGEMK